MPSPRLLCILQCSNEQTNREACGVQFVSSEIHRRRNAHSDSPHTGLESADLARHNQQLDSEPGKFKTELATAMLGGFELCLHQQTASTAHSFELPYQVVFVLEYACAPAPL